MRLIDRYVMRAVAASILLILLVILALDFVFAYIAELEDAANDYQALEALIFMLYTLPRRLYDFLPLAAFMGVLIGLGQLANNSELVVIRAAGVSLARVTWSAMKPALVVVVISLVIGDFVAPVTERLPRVKKRWPVTVVIPRRRVRGFGTAKATSSCISTRCVRTANCTVSRSSGSRITGFRRRCLQCAVSIGKITGYSMM